MKSPAIAIRRKIIYLLTCAWLVIMLTSCYSVRVVSKNGVPEPDPLNMSPDFYRGKKVHVLDTVISLKIQEGGFYFIQPCSSDGFYSFEYRTTFGGLLLNTITLGKKRQVKIKYICLKQTD